jgi:hypothetical protein
MSNCSSSCPTQDHSSWGACVRAKGLRVGWAASHKGIDRTKEKKWEQGLQEYRDARAAGIQPASTNVRDVRAAVAASEATGSAVNASG